MTYMMMFIPKNQYHFLIAVLKSAFLNVKAMVAGKLFHCLSQVCLYLVNARSELVMQLMNHRFH